MKNSTKFWQIAGVLVAVISIIFNVYQHLEKRAAEYTIRDMGRRLTMQAIQLTNANQREAEHLATISSLTISEQNALALAEKYEKESIYHFNQAKKHEALLEYFKKKADEPILPLQLTDDEHYKFFAKWSATIR